MSAPNMSAKAIKIELNNNLIQYICPKCKEILQFKKRRTGTSLCMKCGQRLDWSPVHDISSETIIAGDSDEAAWIANEYYKASGFKESDRIDIDHFRQTLKDDENELYLIFFNPKARGRFMRAYAQEGTIHDG